MSRKGYPLGEAPGKREQEKDHPFILKQVPGDYQLAEMKLPGLRVYNYAERC